MWSTELRKTYNSSPPILYTVRPQLGYTRLSYTRTSVLHGFWTMSSTPKSANCTPSYLYFTQTSVLRGFWVQNLVRPTTTYNRGLTVLSELRTAVRILSSISKKLLVIDNILLSEHIAVSILQTTSRNDLDTQNILLEFLVSSVAVIAFCPVPAYLVTLNTPLSTVLEVQGRMLYSG